MAPHLGLWVRIVEDGEDCECLVCRSMHFLEHVPDQQPPDGFLCRGHDSCSKGSVQPGDNTPTIRALCLCVCVSMQNRQSPPTPEQYPPQSTFCSGSGLASHVVRGPRVTG
eukprot:2535092-Rhodomonas_salina.2